MGELRAFVSEILDRHGAALEESEPDGLEVLAPESLRQALGWPELARLSFGFGGALPRLSRGLPLPQPPPYS